MLCLPRQALLIVLIFGCLVVKGQNNDVDPSLFEENPSDSVSPLSIIQQLLEQYDLKSLLGVNSTFDIGSFISKNGDLIKILQQFFASNSNLLNFKQRLSNITAPCMNKTVEFINALRNQEEWALQTVDAWGKPPSGIFNAGVNWVGEYSMCLNITDYTKKIWKSKYCTVQRPIKPDDGPLTPRIKYGICVSGECNEDDIVDIINFGLSFVLPLIDGRLPINFELIEKNHLDCQGEREYLPITIIVIVFVLVYIVFVIAASLYDIVLERNERKQNELKKDLAATETGVVNQQAKPRPKGLFIELIQTFSLSRNVKKIFHISNNADQFQCLHAIRVISLTWILYGHTYMASINVANNGRVMILWIKQFFFLTISNATFGVDTFFLMSGFLLSYLFVRETKRTGSKITFLFIFKYYFHRIWRLTPVYVVIVCISAFITPHMGEGPFYPKDGLELNMCRNSWWGNFLYINNFVNMNSECLVGSWYIANDMQFHWVAPLMLIPYAIGKRIVGYVMCTLFVICHILTTALIINANRSRGYDLGMINPDAGHEHGFVQDIYFKPWCRIGVFAIGVLLGFYVYEKKELSKFTKFDKRISVIGWLLSIGLCLLMVYGIYPDYSGGQRLSYEARVLYHTFSRLVWAFSISYMIYACISNNGGIINKILSLKFWIPLSRMSFGVYLVHFTIIRFFYYRMEHALYLQHDTMLYFFFSNWTISFLISFLVTIFLELPIVGLEKFILPRKK